MGTSNLNSIYVAICEKAWKNYVWCGSTFLDNYCLQSANTIQHNSTMCYFTYLVPM